MTTHPDKRPVAPGSEVSPKLDGIHAVARKDGIFTKSGKPIDRADLRRRLKLHFLLHPKSELKGELYRHGQPFDKNLSDFKKGEKLPFHAFPGQKHRPLPIFGVKRVKGERVRSEKDADAHYQRSLKQGYEGQVVRTPDGKEAKRKPHSDAEHEIVAARPGKTQGSLTVRDGDKTFKVPVTRDVAASNPVGKKATIISKGRHKVFKSVRDYEMSAVEREILLMQPKGYKRPVILPGQFEDSPTYQASYQHPSIVKKLYKGDTAAHQKARKGGIIYEQSKHKRETIAAAERPMARREHPAAFINRVRDTAAQEGRDLRRHEIVHSLVQQRRGAPPATTHQLLKEEVTAYGRTLFPNASRGKWKEAARGIAHPVRVLRNAADFAGGVAVSTLKHGKHLKRAIKLSSPLTPILLTMPYSDQISRSEPTVGQRARRRLRNAAIGAVGAGIVGGKIYKGGANWKQAAAIGGGIGFLVPPRDSVLIEGRKKRPSPFRFSAKEKLIQWVGAHPKTATGIAAGAGGYIMGRRKRRQSVDINVVQGPPNGEKKVQLADPTYEHRTQPLYVRHHKRPVKKQATAREPIPLMVDHRGAPTNWEFEGKKEQDQRNATLRAAVAGGAVGAGSGYIASGGDSEWQTVQKLRRMADEAGGATPNERDIAGRKIKDVLRRANKKQALRMVGHGAAGAVAVGGLVAARHAIQKSKARRHEFAEQDKRKLRNARDAALTAGGLATVGTAGVLGWKALKAVKETAKQVKDGVSTTVKNSADASKQVGDILKNQVAPAMEKTRQAAHVYGTGLDAVRPIVDAGAPIVKKASERAARTIHSPVDVRDGYREGKASPNRKSRAYRAGRASSFKESRPKHLKTAFKDAKIDGYHNPKVTSKAYRAGRATAKTVNRVRRALRLSDGRIIIMLAEADADPHRKLKKWAKRAVVGTVSSAALFKGARLVGTKRGRKTLREIGEVLHKNSDRGQLEAMRRSVKAKMPIIKKRAADKAVAEAEAAWRAKAMPKPPTEPGFVDAVKETLKRGKRKAVNKIANIGNDELPLSSLDKEVLLWSDNSDYVDPRFQHQKARRQLTAEEHAQIKRDRRKLLTGTAVGGTGALALTGYLGQDTATGKKLKKDINREVVARYKAAPKGRKLKAAWNGVKRLFSQSAEHEILFYTPTQATDKKGRRTDPVGAAVTGRRVYVGNTNAAGERVYERIPILHHQVVDSTMKKARGVQKWAGRVGALAKDTVQAVAGKPRQRDAYGRTKKREWEKAWFKNAAGTAALGGAGLAVLRHARANPDGKIARGLRAGRKFISKAGKIFTEARLDDQILLDETQGDWDVRDARGRSARVFAPGSRKRVRREKEWYEKSDNERKLWQGATVASGLAGAGITALLYRGRRLKVPAKMRVQTGKPPVPKNPARSEASRKAAETRKAGDAVEDIGLPRDKSAAYKKRDQQ